MMTVTEKVAYLKGLAKGLDLAKDKAETKMFDAIMEVLEDMALTVSDLEDEVVELGEQVDAVDEDLAELEELFFDEDACGCCDDDDMYEVECPACHETIYLDECILEDGEIECPNCGTELEFDFDCDCEDCCGDDDEDDDEDDEDDDEDDDD